MWWLFSANPENTSSSSLVLVDGIRERVLSAVAADRHFLCRNIGFVFYSFCFCISDCQPPFDLLDRCHKGEFNENTLFPTYAWLWIRDWGPRLTGTLASLFIHPSTQSARSRNKDSPLPWLRWIGRGARRRRMNAVTITSLCWSYD